MTFAMIAAELQARFARAIFNQFPDALDPYLVIEPAAIPVVALALRDDFGFAVLNNLAGVDYLETDPKKVAKVGFEPHLEVVYHLSSFARPGLRFTFKVILPRDGAEVPSVAGIWRTADWHEREAFDLFGIRFVGHPDPRRILLSEDWVGHPLRKDYEFPLEYHDIRCR